MRKLRIKAFNDVGIAAFRKFLADLREDGSIDIPYEMLEDESLTTAVRGTAFIEEVNIPTRMDAAKYLNSAIVSHLDPNEYENNNMWAWISLFFFDQLCPVNKYGKRKLGMDYRYIPTENYKTFHRNLLKIPFKIYNIHKEDALILLFNPVIQPGDLNENIVSRQNLIGNKTIIQALGMLYYDKQLGKAKRGILTKNKKSPGSLMRFWKFLTQLELTYDLHSITPTKLLILLPLEFDGFKKENLKLA